MTNNENAGKFARKEDLIDVDDVVNKYYSLVPNPSDPTQKVTFGTSGHRGSSLNSAFNEAHIVACTMAIVEWRKENGVTGPLFIGYDTHLLSIPAFQTALEVLSAMDIKTYIDSRDSFVPTPALSHAIIRYNRGRKVDLADGIVITPSHNPPQDGGFKYNPTNGGPADTTITKVIEDRANEIIRQGFENVPRIPFETAKTSKNIQVYNYRKHYVEDLKNIIDMDAIKNSSIKIGADPLGGASVEYWEEIKNYYGLNLEVVNPKVDPTFSFMTLDWDGKIRMDCSSPFAMKSLSDKMKDNPKWDIATGNDADSDRHGIVTKDRGLMNPNHYLAVAIDYLIQNRPNWPKTFKIGKTLVSSSLINKVVEDNNKEIVEVPVGFKYFVDGLIDGTIAFGGEESAGGSFLRFNGEVWTTDKDGILLDLLASEIYAKTGKSPSQLHNELVEKFGDSYYERIDAPATLEEKEKLANLSPDDVKANELAGDEITAKFTKASGNNAKIGGLKVETKNSWFVARPSGTENVYKIYAESFVSKDHLKLVQEEAKKVVSEALR